MPRKPVKPCVDCTAELITTRRPTPHPGPRCATHHRARRSKLRKTSHSRHIEATYGITAAEYEQLLAHQAGTCFICRRATGARKRLAVDHSHSSGEVRGLLCKSCNRDVLGHLRDDVAAAQRVVAYLTDPPALRVIGRRVVPNHEG
ncbi:endonuclease VII domain-containing protein [Nocardia iowensis]|uniref:Endonuclease VII domain-containing protein n=1 Tax=Nocardia iowensis TaxID=204891 RepID=A0ABX8RSH4_NOCIO|nr:endonuclease VII domain-containing protein [Nocardia iowensis]